MGYIDIAQIVFIVLVFTVGIIGFIRAAISDDS